MLFSEKLILYLLVVPTKPRRSSSGGVAVNDTVTVKVENSSTKIISVKEEFSRKIKEKANEFEFESRPKVLHTKLLFSIIVFHITHITNFICFLS